MLKAIKIYFQKENKYVENPNMFSNTWFMFTQTSETGFFGRFFRNAMRPVKRFL